MKKERVLDLLAISCLWVVSVAGAGAVLWIVGWLLWMAFVHLNPVALIFVGVAALFTWIVWSIGRIEKRRLTIKGKPEEW